MGFPTDFFPVLFAIPRATGWLAHWKESLEETAPKIWRPRQIYTGHARRPYQPMEERKEEGEKPQVEVPISVHPYNRRYTMAMRSKM
jgi:citrate synthase